MSIHRDILIYQQIEALPELSGERERLRILFDSIPGYTPTEEGVARWTAGIVELLRLRREGR